MSTFEPQTWRRPTRRVEWWNPMTRTWEPTTARRLRAVLGRRIADALGPEPVSVPERGRYRRVS